MCPGRVPYVEAQRNRGAWRYGAIWRAVADVSRIMKSLHVDTLFLCRVALEVLMGLYHERAVD